MLVIILAIQRLFQIQKYLKKWFLGIILGIEIKEMVIFFFYELI